MTRLWLKTSFYGLLVCGKYSVGLYWILHVSQILWKFVGCKMTHVWINAITEKLNTEKAKKKRESLKIKNKNLWDLWTPLKSTLLQHTLHFFSRILFIHAEKPFFFLIPHAKFLWSICFFLVICMFHLRLVECIFVYFMFNLLSTRDLCLHTLCTPAAHLTDMNWKFLYK